MQMQMQISFSQKGVTVAVGERTVLLGRRARMAMAVAFTLLVHILILWTLSAYRARDMDISMTYDSPVDTTLYRPEPIPEPVPPLHQLRQEPIPAAPPIPRPEVEPTPSPQPQPAPQQAQAQPVPEPTPQRVAPRQVDNVQAINTPTAKAIQQPQPTLQDAAANVPTVSDEPSPTPQKVKKKEEEQALDAKRQMTAAAVPAPSDLNLHETPVPSVSVSPVAPSGLTPNPSSRLAAGGGTPSAGGAAAPGGQSGTGLKGRGSATQALQNHEDCVSRQTEGKPIPPSCKMKDYASMQSVGPRPDADFQAAAAQRDARRKYKTDPGNADYWNRVGHNPSTFKPSENDHPTPGAYDSAKDQRVMTHQ